MGTASEKGVEYFMGKKKLPPFDEKQWVEDVFNGDYILVIGPEVILAPTEENPSGDVNQFILSKINGEHIINAPFNSFTEMASFLSTDLVLDCLNSDFRYEIKDMTPELCGLLNTRLFPIVLTTTFDGYLETLMRSIWGDRLRVVNILDKESLLDFKKTLEEYPRGVKPFKNSPERDRYNEPTLFYLFGKAIPDEYGRPREYSRTEEDAIKSIDTWFGLKHDAHPVLDLIRGRKLLSLGCKFDDWYFRLFWFILRGTIEHLYNGQVAFFLDESDRSDRQLGRFLERSHIRLHPDAREFMKKMTAALQASVTDNVFFKMLEAKRREGGVFLSYCSEDVRVVGQLFVRLVKQGFNVWFDNSRLRGGDPYDPLIRKAIEASRVFISVLSPQVMADYSAGKTDRYYLMEWGIARQYEDKRFIPLAVNGYELRSSAHAVVYESKFEHRLTGIDLTDKDGFNQLSQVISESLNN